MFSFLLLAFNGFVLHATAEHPAKKQCRERCIAIESFRPDQAQAISSLEGSGEYGEGVFFRSIQRGQPRALAQDSLPSSSSEPSAGAPTDDKSQTLISLAAYYDQHLGDRNPLFVQCEFFADPEHLQSCGLIHMGLFVSGNESFAIDGETCKKMDEAKKVLQQFKDPKVVVDFMMERASQQIEKQGVYYKIPEFQNMGNRVPPISCGDLCADEGKSRLSHKDSVMLRFAQHIFQEPFGGSLFEHESHDKGRSQGCLQSAFSGCFSHSEEAWLDFLENPRPRHIFFSQKFDIRSAANVQVTLFSYNDICRYCRGTLSFLQRSGCLQQRLNDFFKKLPAIMNTHWQQCSIKQKIFQGSESVQEPQMIPLFFPEFSRMNYNSSPLLAWSYYPIDDKVRGVGKK